MAVGEHFNYPIQGYPVPNGKVKADGTVIDPAALFDPDSMYVEPTASTIGGLILAKGDYNPKVQFRGFEVHGAQTLSTVMVMFANHSIGRYDNITIAAGGGCYRLDNLILLMILSTANGTTASGVHPIF
jgi:hypothetical protein